MTNRTPVFYGALVGLVLGVISILTSFGLFIAAIWSNDNQLEENLAGTGGVLLVVGIIVTFVAFCFLDNETS